MNRQLDLLQPSCLENLNNFALAILLGNINWCPASDCKHNGQGPIPKTHSDMVSISKIQLEEQISVWGRPRPSFATASHQTAFATNHLTTSSCP